MSAFISATCQGETCRCGAPAVAKIGEEIAPDDPHPHRHNLTAYVCARHYALLLGPKAAQQVGYDYAEPNDTVIDRDRLRRIRMLAEEAAASSPTPWQHTPRTRTLYGNESGYLADRDSNWIATFDGEEENDFSAEVDPAVAVALVDLVEVLISALEQGPQASRAAALYRLSCALALRAGFQPREWTDEEGNRMSPDQDITLDVHRPAYDWFRPAAEALYANLEVRLKDD